MKERIEKLSDQFSHVWLNMALPDYWALCFWKGGKGEIPGAG